MSINLYNEPSLLVLAKAVTIWTVVLINSLWIPSYEPSIERYGEGWGQPTFHVDQSLRLYTLSHQTFKRFPDGGRHTAHLNIGTSKSLASKYSLSYLERPDILSLR